MISYSIIPIRELIDFLEYIEKFKKGKKSKRLHKIYCRIYFILNEMQDCNYYFLKCIQRSYENESIFFFMQALSSMKNIACLTSKILGIESRPFSDYTISQILLLEDRDLFLQFRKIIGTKEERITFWRNVADSVLESSTECRHNIRNSPKSRKPFIRLYSILEEYSKDIDSSIRSEDVVVDKNFLKQQIEISEKIISEFDLMIDRMSSFVKRHVVTLENIF